ncbi:uncharacterized protein CcaverHIS019_0107880 [Cutaneotrichosporon cavernicola]|uniref:TOM13-domain-containing protein n=1 Tax=Cutaneotrichosporon cavernicola TaxID=279322 RepID=A0AA48L0D3_9TREE|nr:uncharacterized protein CcaverHIS019_0107880 [Cutaneotrichosporon cavernicola]BEI88070.1 hypothetical protein CcaverHIS019_0107880 [Cutaneotrichosporon cavernicola]BEI95841.1 hypothetical protein CcaverHIS631_0107900 [Cutaneotrichosporon cavernicola]BEJ03615.1 hypothetical protein CcaverHIS641_0107900 [Cutaneotrichosporon cavernicola]
MSDNNSGIEDTLAAAFDSSFTMPAAEPRLETEKAASPASEPTAPEEEGEGEGEGGEDWKPTYEANLAQWRAEADEARQKAEETRAKFEAEQAAEAQAVKDEAKKAADAKKAAEKEAAHHENLASALETSPAPATVPAHKRAVAEERDRKTREAWEMVKPKAEEAASSPSAPPSTAWEELSGTQSSIEDISASPVVPATGSYGSSRSGGSSSPEKPKPKAAGTKGDGKKEDIPFPAGITPTSQGVNQAAGAAAVPEPANATPSLTLSIFTAPGGLTTKRVLAALGINLLLPFINGIMLGLGEITAREFVRVGRLWWKGERAIAGIWRKDGNVSGSGFGARNVSNVGLSGGAGF